MTLKDLFLGSISLHEIMEEKQRQQRYARVNLQLALQVNESRKQSRNDYF